MEPYQFDVVAGIVFLSQEVFTAKKEKEEELQTLSKNFLKWRKKNRLRYWLSVAFSVR